MKNKRYIVLGVAFLVSAILFSNLQFVFGRENYIESINVNWALKIVSITFTLLGISEFFFIKSRIVPKWLRIIIYWQWIQVPIIIIPTWLYYSG